MTLPWHIARKDLMRLRPVLLLWAAVLTGHMALATIGSRLDESGYQPFYVGAFVFGVVFLPCFGMGLVMGVIQDDSVCGTDAFWITRPIPPAQLLAAKVLVLGLLALFPAAVLAPWWWTHGFDFNQTFSAVGHTFRWYGTLMLLAVPIAVISPSTGRFIIGGIGAMLALILLESVHVPLAAWHRGHLGKSLNGDAWIRLMLLTWFCVGVVVTLNQFLTRRTTRSVLLGVVTVLAGFAISNQPVEPSKRIPPAATEPAQVSATLNASLHASALVKGTKREIVELFPDFMRGIVMTVSESSPDYFSLPAWMKVPSGPIAKPIEQYFLVDRKDGRSTRATIGKQEGIHSAGALEYRRIELVFSAPAEWNQDPAFNFNEWARDAVMIRVVGGNVVESLPTHLRHPESFPSP